MSKPVKSPPDHMPAALPDHWITEIFSRMRATYGAAFDRQWECPPSQDPGQFATTLRRHWATELRAWGTDATKSAIGWALDHMPSYPPNLVQFKDLCRAAPMSRPMALQGPKPDLKRLGSEIRRLAEVRAYLDRPGLRQGRAWVDKLRAKAEAGYPLTHDQRLALKEQGDTPTSGGTT